MKKISFFVILWLLTSAFVTGISGLTDLSDGGAIWLAASDGGKPNSPQLIMRKMDDSSLELTVTFSGIWATAIQTEQGQFTSLFFDEFGEFAKVGYPDLPQYTALLEIAENSPINIKNIQTHFKSLKLSEYNLPGSVFPMQPPSPKSGSAPDWVPPQENLYQTDQFFPGAFVELLPTFQQRDHAIQPVQIYPVRYNPVKAELQILQSITIVFGVNPVVNSVKITNPQLKNAVFDSLYADVIEVPSENLDDAKGISAGEKYLIISPDIFLSQLSPFITLKQSQGFDVTLVSLGQIGSSTTDGIKKYIQNAYDTWQNPPTYLLLIGDSNIMPTWSFKPSDITSYGRKTDLYYATMDGVTDYVPDIFYGRLPARDATQLNNMLSKITAYVQNDGIESWVKKAAFISTCDSGNWDFVIDSHEYVINSFTTPLGFTGIFPNDPQIGGDKLYCRTGESTFNTNVTNNIIAAINDQRSIIIYSGHGDETSLRDSSYISIYQSTIRNLTDNQITPFVSSFACRTGDFANPEIPESFGETWMIQPLKGSVAYLGSADFSYWGPDDKLERSMYASLLSVPEDPNTVDQAIFSGLQAVQTYYPLYGQYYWETYNLLGDPSTQVWIGPRPSDFVIQFPAGKVDVCKGSEVDSLIEVNSYDGFSDPVTLSLSGLPEHVAGQFDPNPVTPNNFSTLQINASTDALEGDYDVILHGLGGSIEHEIHFQLGIDSAIPNYPSLILPPDSSINQTTTPTFAWENDSLARSYHIQVAVDAEFTKIMIDQDGLLTPNFTPAVALESLTKYYWRVKASDACGDSTFSPAFTFDTRRDIADCEHITDTVILYQNDFETEPSDWSTASWLWDVTRFMSPNHAYYVPALALVSDQRLISPTISIPETSFNTTMRFWQWRNLESNTTECLDAGVVEYSTNNGSDWIPLSNSMVLSDPFDGIVETTFLNPLGNYLAWCGQQDWTKTIIDITSLAGNSATFRFRLGTDNSTGSEGWYMDDFRIQACIESYLFSVSCTPREISQLKGTTVHYPITLTNDSRPDSYLIEISENAWETILEIDQTEVLEFEDSVTFDVAVTIPVNASSGTFDSVKVTVTSIADQSQKQEIILTTTALETYFQYIPIILQ